ncbi:MAG TPA: ankyrin repeat domain-containing protein [Candidatus Dormibacteraeota bacterium]|nr:ankyrin repeat domain-containing protein [Candidatus Dormibacteraeota bacterium]
MPDRHLPVRPNPDQLKRQAKELLSDFRRGDPNAAADLQKYHPKKISGADAKLADAQLVLARSYGVASWPRLARACNLVDAIWRDDQEMIRKMVLKHPELIKEMARGTEKCNWGPPMSYAANLGRAEIISLLHKLGAKDHMYALGRAALQGQIETARSLHTMMGSPRMEADALSGPAYTLNVPGTKLMLEMGAKVIDEHGKSVAPVSVVLETDSRNPPAKHQILELYVQHGLELPDTPPMAVHRGRIDLLEKHLRQDAGLLSRTFSHEEIYPPEWGCGDEVMATHGTPLAGATLLHMSVDYDEMEIARWLIERGMNVNAKASVDAEGFGGHTALFATVVSQPNFWMNHNGLPQVAPFAQLLLDHGADPNARASLRKQLHPGYGEDFMHEYRDVTPLSWGMRFHNKKFVSAAAMELIAQRGGK